MNSLINRSAQGQFLKGHSGNPRGRPKCDINLAELARSYTKEAVETIVAIMRNSKDDMERLRAAAILLERGYGKSPQAMPIEEEDKPLPVLQVIIQKSGTFDSKASQQFLPEPTSPYVAPCSDIPLSEEKKICN